MMKKRLVAVALLLVACVTVLHAVATYPSGIASFPTRVNGQTIDATWFNSLQDEVIAIETGLINGFGHVLKPSSSATYDLGTSALLWNKLYVGSIYQSATNPYTGWTVVTSTNTGTQNDFAPGLVGNTVVRMNNATLATITGFAGGYDGQLVDVVSVGAGQVDLSYQTGSTAANQLTNLATVGQTSLSPGKGYSRYRYDGTSTKWRLYGHEQGAWIDYSATSTVTGWSAFTTKIIKYRLAGVTLQVWFNIDGTSNATSAQFTIPYTHSATTLNTQMLGRAMDNAALNHGRMDLAAGGTTLQAFLGDAAGSWTNVNQKIITGTVTVEVQ